MSQDFQVLVILSMKKEPMLAKCGDGAKPGICATVAWPGSGGMLSDFPKFSWGKPFCWENHRLLLVPSLERLGKSPLPHLCCCFFLTVYNVLVLLRCLKNVFYKEPIKILYFYVYITHTYVEFFSFFAALLFIYFF